MTQDNPISVRGPALRFETLFDEETTSEGEGKELHPDFAAVYGGPLRLEPPVNGLPLLAANFVTSHDGRVAWNHPDHRGGGPISGFDDNDVWLMGLAPRPSRCRSYRRGNPPSRTQPRQHIRRHLSRRQGCLRRPPPAREPLGTPHHLLHNPRRQSSTRGQGVLDGRRPRGGGHYQGRRPTDPGPRCGLRAR